MMGSFISVLGYASQASLVPTAWFSLAWAILDSPDGQQGRQVRGTQGQAEDPPPCLLSSTCNKHAW